MDKKPFSNRLYSFSSSNSITFQDFFNDLSKFSMTIGLAATFKISKHFACFKEFFDLTQ